MRLQNVGPSVVIGDHKAIKRPLVSEDFGEQTLVPAGGDAVDAVVGAHDVRGFRLLDAGFECGHVRFPHRHRGHVCVEGCSAGGNVFNVVDCKVFAAQARQQVLAVGSNLCSAMTSSEGRAHVSRTPGSCSERSLQWVASSLSKVLKGRRGEGGGGDRATHPRARANSREEGEKAGRVGRVDRVDRVVRLAESPTLLFCAPVTQATTNRDIKCGSSPYVSWPRPHRGSLATARARARPVRKRKGGEGGLRWLGQPFERYN